MTTTSRFPDLQARVRAVERALYDLQREKGLHPHNLRDHLDARRLAQVSDTDSVEYDKVLGAWKPGAGGGGADVLDDLLDVTVPVPPAEPAHGSYFVYDLTVHQWVAIIGAPAGRPNPLIFSVAGPVVAETLPGYTVPDAFTALAVHYRYIKPSPARAITVTVRTGATTIHTHTSTTTGGTFDQAFTVSVLCAAGAAITVQTALGSGTNAVPTDLVVQVRS